MKLSRQPVISSAVKCGRMLIVQSIAQVPELPGGGRIMLGKVLDPEMPIRPRAGELPITSPAASIARIYDRLVEENEAAIEAALALAEQRGFEVLQEMLG